MQSRAWPLVKRWIDHAANDVEVLAPDTKGGARVLEALDVTERSVLGALAVHTGGLSVDHNLLRVLGGPALLEWQDKLDDGLVVGHDAAGGFFAVGKEDGEVRYLLPGGYEWLETEMGHAAWVHWTLMGDLEGFYADMREPGWEAQTTTLSPDQGISASGPAPMSAMWAAQRKRIRPLAGR
jgi:Protein of unknown function DUF2625